MAQAHTTTLLADHKGITRPKVCGDEYIVDAVVDVTSHVESGAIIPASDFGLSTIHCATICGIESANGIFANIRTTNGGAYLSTTSISLMFTSLDGTNGTVAADADPACAVRLRVWGNL